MTDTYYSVATDIFRVNAVRAISFGSATTTYRAIGNIDTRHISDTPVYNRVLIGMTRGRNLIYTVPSGKTLYITSLTVGVGKGSTTGNLATFTLRGTWDAKIGVLLAGLHFTPYAEINHQDGAFLRVFEMPIKCIEKTDIKMSVTCGQSSTVCTCALRGWIE